MDVGEFGKYITITSFVASLLCPGLAPSPAVGTRCKLPQDTLESTKILQLLSLARVADLLRAQ